MRNNCYLTVIAVLVAWFAGSVAYAQQSTTVGGILDKGGKKLTKVEVTQLVSGATVEGVQGGNFPDTTFKNVFAADGTVRGDAWFKGAWFSKINGKWSVNDAGQVCTELRNDKGENIAGCQAYYVVGDSYYAARSDSKTSEANFRKFSR